MRKKITKTVALALTGAMILGSFAGCGNKETKTDELKDMLADPAIQSDYIKLGEIQAQIDELEMEILEDMEEWENISTELEQYQ